MSFEVDMSGSNVLKGRERGGREGLSPNGCLILVADNQESVRLEVLEVIPNRRLLGNRLGIPHTADAREGRVGQTDGLAVSRPAKRTKKNSGISRSELRCSLFPPPIDRDRFLRGLPKPRSSPITRLQREVSIPRLSPILPGAATGWIWISLDMTKKTTMRSGQGPRLPRKLPRTHRFLVFELHNKNVQRAGQSKKPINSI